MVIFRYALNQDLIELQASNWSGLEQLFINGKRVSRKLSFGQQSEHKFKLNNGYPCRFHLHIDPNTQEMICRIYNRDKLITSLNQGKKSLAQSKQLVPNIALFCSIVTLLLVLIQY